MIRPQKIMGKVSENSLIEAIENSYNLEIGRSHSVDFSAIYPVYYVPTAVLMTENNLYSLWKDQIGFSNLNHNLETREFTFQGLIIATVRSVGPEWYQVV